MLCVVSFSIVVVVPCFFFNYCRRRALFLFQLLLVLCLVSFSIVVGVMPCFFFNYC